MSLRQVDTYNLPCVSVFGSFQLQDMFLNLQLSAFEGQDIMSTVNLLLTCIVNCDTRPGYD